MPPKKRSKENISPSVDGVKDVELGPPPSKRGRAKKVQAADEGIDMEEHVPMRASTSTPHDASSGELQRQRDDCSRLRKERDTFAAQLEKLTQLRESNAESLLEKYKEAAEKRAKVQDAVIEKWKALNEKQSAKVQALEEELGETKATLAKVEASRAPPTFDAKLDSKSAKELREEVYKLRDLAKAKEADIETVKKELTAEVEHSRKLMEAQPRAASKAPVSNAQPSPETAKLIELYEDVTRLDVHNVSIKPRKAGDEPVFTCVQTVGNRNYQFKLRLFKQFDRKANQWERSVEIIPLDIQNETDKRFLERLGPFSHGFIIPRDQLGEAWKQLCARMSPEGKFEEPILD